MMRTLMARLSTLPARKSSVAAVAVAAVALAVSALVAGGCAQSDSDLSGQAGGGLPMPDQIAGSAWLDENGDGNRNAGEVPAARVEALLRNDANGDGTCNAAEDVIVAKALTDDQGRYEFSTVDVGSYCVEIGPQHSAAGAPATYGLTIDGVTGHSVDVPVP
jgi:hypothetical protein